MKIYRAWINLKSVIMGRLFDLPQKFSCFYILWNDYSFVFETHSTQKLLILFPPCLVYLYTKFYSFSMPLTFAILILFLSENFRFNHQNYVRYWLSVKFYYTFCHSKGKELQFKNISLWHVNRWVKWNTENLWQNQKV